MRTSPKLTLLAASFAAAFVLALPASSGARADERPGAAVPAPAEQQTPPPATGACPYRGGKLELIA
jgi:hypothetical protein